MGSRWTPLLLLLLTVHSYALWPAPTSLSLGNTPLRLSSSIDITYSFNSPPSDLQDAVSQTKSYLKNDKLGRLVPDRGASDNDIVSKSNTLSSLSLVLNTGGGQQTNPKSISDEIVQDINARDESYALTIPEDGTGANITANSTLGLFRGLTSFGQLWYTANGETYTLQAPVKIADRPAFPYRGFMLDTARNFFPVEDIKRTLDAMSWVKLNTFHWHAVDSQSFPLQIPGFHELSDKGAYDPGWVYTEEDVKDIISYAGARGIDVVVEIDTPGHTSVISKSHPDLVACAESTPWASFASEPPGGQLRLVTPATLNFTSSLYKAVANQFPSKFISTGGDEIKENCYKRDAETQNQLHAKGQSFEEALNVFTHTNHKVLEEGGKDPVVWEEMVLNYDLPLSNKTVVMVWISSANVRAVAKKRFRIIHAASDYFYLDCGGGGWVGNNPSGNSWCDPFKTWQKSYSFDPFAGLNEAQKHLVLGGEHLLWTEQSGPENLDPVTWPRAATSAEIFWTGERLPDRTQRTSSAGLKDALPRLHDVAYRFKQRGVNAIPLQPRWCALRPGVCDLTA